MKEKCMLVKGRTLIAVVVCLLGLTIVACTSVTHFTEDLLEEHYDFLYFSLGDFELLREIPWYDSFPGQRVSGREWHLQFVRHDGTVAMFPFKNGRSMGGEVTGWASRYGVAQLQALAEDYFSQESFRHRSGVPRASIVMHFQRDRELDYSRILDPESGLQLHSVTLTELADWDFSFRIVVGTSDHENYLDVIERLKGMTRTLAAYFGQEQVEVRFTLHIGEEVSAEYSRSASFVGYYHKQTDIFEIE